MKVVKRPSDQHYWVVRAQGGRYAQNFKEGGVVAIKHLDYLNIKSGKFFPEKDALLAKMLEHAGVNSTRSKAQINNHYNQAIRFIYEIKIGDWIICPTSNSVMIGRVIGQPYISKDDVEVIIDPETGTSIKMRSNLRRNVEWGPIVSRTHLAPSINRALRANQSIFSLNDYWDLLYHAIYPCFVDDEKFYFSIRINQKKNIDNYSISHLLSYLSESEAAAVLCEHIDISNDKEFQKEFFALRLDNKLFLHTKAQFMSPGDILGSLPIGSVDVTKEMLWFYLIYSSIFGSKIIGWSGVIDYKLKNEILDFVKKKWAERGGETTKKALQISQPQYVTHALEDASKDEKRERKPVTIIDLEQVFNQRKV